LAELQADALGLALRFASDGNGVVGAELMLALKECLQACEAVVLDATSARQRLGLRRKQTLGLASDEVSWVREQHVTWLISLKERLLQEAADAHRKAERARRMSDTRGARRLFGIKNRCEAVAAALGDLAAHSDGSEG